MNFIISILIVGMNKRHWNVVRVMEAGTVWALYKYVLYHPVNSITVGATNDGKL